jgi:hypothetical protein
VAEPLIEHTVVQIGAEEAERADRELGGGEAREVGPARQAIRDLRPARLPQPRPAMKAATITVAEWTSEPEKSPAAAARRSDRRARRSLRRRK